MPASMVWPPPTVLAPPEGEAPADSGGESAPQAAASKPGSVPPPVSWSAVPPQATSLPPDWLQRPDALLGGVLGGRYRVTRVLGRGPMGIACEGESARGRQVTLKLIPRPPELPVEHFAWQVRQALALAHFDHAHVAPINDFGALDGGSAFVSRNRVPGVTLRSMLQQGSLPIRRSLQIVRQIALALDAAHAQDITHGRLKPENIIIQGGSAPGDTVKVVDFGMSGLPVDLRAVAPNEQDARRLALRTRLYLPAGPASVASPALDVYSLGVILFEMIAGQPPFAFETMGSGGPAGPPLSFAQCNLAIPVPAAVNDLVIAMLHPDAAQHGVNANRLVLLLDTVLGRASEAPPTFPAEPITAQHQSAPPPEPRVKTERPPLAQGQSPEGTPAGTPPFWPSQTPTPPVSWPPLPQGFSGSSAPPPPVAYNAPTHPEYPSGPPVGVASGTYPPGPADMDGYPPQGFAPEGGDATDEDDTNFRPSLLGRLRRLFGKAKPGGF